ncbi:imm11 family protein [Roseibium sp. MMSF_3544]|uniref:imm11 family protein n=1 Tax=unclassified Roseibium TaxID=2629323 RepID=UPI00273DDF2A|nr:DUF1629 domain-containing protein [Roseibium sp. MMSF_3544]
MAYWLKMAFDAREPSFEFEDEPEKMRLFGLSLGIPVGTERLPTKAREITEKKVYPDIMTMPGLNAVSAKFKQIVEEFEPELHQFFPLRLTRKDGSLVEDEYFIFNCTVSFDSLLFQHSEVDWIYSESKNKCPWLEIKDFRVNALSKPAIQGRHIWSNFRLRCPGIYISDAFHRQLKDEKIRYCESFFCEELDIPWVASENVQPILDWEKKHGLERGMKPWLLQHQDELK